MAITLTDNEFFSGLTNLALFMRIYAGNTSRKPDDFVDAFMTDVLDVGNTKIFPYADLPSVANYSETSSLLTVTKPTVGEEYLQVTEKKVVKSSYSAKILDAAFTSEYGMNDFIGYLLGQMESAKTAYLYDVIINDLFTKSYGAGSGAGAKQLHTVDMISYTGLTSLADLNGAHSRNAKALALAIQDDIENIQVYNTVYNRKGLKEAIDYKDLRIVILAPYRNEDVMEVMASLLKSDVITRDFDKPDVLIIPSIKIPENRTQEIAWILHKASYQLFYKFTVMTNFFDASNLCVNNFLHFWYGKGWVDALPSCKLIKNEISLSAEA